MWSWSFPFGPQPRVVAQPDIGLRTQAVGQPMLRVLERLMDVARSSTCVEKTACVLKQRLQSLRVDPWWWWLAGKSQMFVGLNIAQI